MTDFTDIHGLPVPDQLPSGEGPDVPADLLALAEAIDGKLTPVISGNGTPAATATDPGKPGRRYRDTATGDIYLDIGSEWVIESAAVAAGDGIGVAGRTISVALAIQPGLEISGGALRSSVDDATIERSGLGLRLKDAGVTAAKLAAALKPSGGAGAGAEALRALGRAAGQALAGNVVSDWINGNLLGAASAAAARASLGAATANLPGWLALPRQPAWDQQNTTCSYRRDDTGEVRLKGQALTSAGTPLPSTVAILPAGYTPPQTLWFLAPYWTGATNHLALVLVYANGHVDLFSDLLNPGAAAVGVNGIVGLDGIRFDNA